MSRLRLGCIADDFTGATDLANNLVRAGMRVVQAIGEQGDDAPTLAASPLRCPPRGRNSRLGAARRRSCHFAS